VSAVYAHDIHTATQKTANKIRIVSGIPRHSYHNANVAIGGRLAECFNRIFLKQKRARIVFGEGLLDRAPVPIFASKLVKQIQESVERGDHMGFQAPKRCERQPAEVFLQFADVMPAQAQIVDEISRALKVTRIDMIEFLPKVLLRLQYLKPNGLES
jgi:hypothetical protein